MHIVIVGGGAAGYFAAIRARMVGPRRQVTIVEAAARPLQKVRISGGGRCNLTHACFDVERLVGHYPRGQKALRSIFRRFSPRQTLDWFQGQGVELKTEPDGRIFPVSDDSQTIIDCLLGAARKLGVETRLSWPVLALERTGSGFRLRSKQETLEADRVVLATGGAPTAYPWLRALGHTIVAPVPSLFTFNVPDPRLHGLAGVSVAHVRGTLPGIPTQEGPLLITHWGLSGPVILRLSAWGARMLAEQGYRAELLLDLLPEGNQEQIRQELLARKRDEGRKGAANQPMAGIPRRFWKSLLGEHGGHLWGDIPDKSLNRLAETLKRCRFAIEGKGVFKEEFVVAGGLPLEEIRLERMESALVPGLFAAGELLDVDGLTGGFNFQNAWSTGWIAGESAAGP